MLLFDFSLGATIIFIAPMDFILSSMGLSAAEGTPKIMAPGIPGVGEKQYPAVPALGETPS
jgi:hypothetical protein